MDPFSFFILISVQDPSPGESRMAFHFMCYLQLRLVAESLTQRTELSFHFTRKPESSIHEPRFDDVMRAYDLEVTNIMYTEFEEMLTLYVFAAGYDWTAHKQETLKICE
ncbi:uncharacterized protein FSUBG_11474 [Fusarium subglutinans]|uniref:Uncharacterized protein n=1 Tax=Gibberella subglutinans TaxID=42677 RepID=A0A8H5L8Y2_GIBSU|nr:uncharacterized protein FSUBG_11474 [Fusarium subglutinans]KAF5588554.1 hypothetical protein FSUBG_11474 [Fusarium subglutinans]